jgi:hypothetical protein
MTENELETLVTVEETPLELVCWMWREIVEILLDEEEEVNPMFI